MSEPQLLYYIKQNLEKGVVKEQVWEGLKQAGWQEKHLKKAFQELGLLDIDVLPGMGDLLERSFELYKKQFWTLMGIALFPTLVAMAAFGIGTFLFLIGSLARISLIDNLVLILFLSLVVLIFFVALVVISLWSQVALLYAIKEGERRIGIKEAFTKAWSKIVSYWLVSVLLAFFTLGGILLFLVPGVIMSVWFGLALYVLIAEDKKGMSALFRSKQLVAGNWWKIFWRQIALFLIILVIYFIASFIPSLRFFTNLLIAPFTYVFFFLLYQDLKRLKKDPYFEAPKTATKFKFISVAAMGYFLTAVAALAVWLLS